MKMEYVASHYRKQAKGAPGETCLLLQQASYRENRACLALVCGDDFGGAGKKGDMGAVSESARLAVRKACAEEVLDWLYKKVFSRWGRASLWSFQKSCRELSGLLQHFSGEDGVFILTGMFCINNRFLLFSKGSQRTYHIHTRFLKPHLKEISGESAALLIQTGTLEPEAGILLGTEPFFQGLSGEMIQTCLSQGDLHTKLQADRHLRELGEAGAWKGNKAAVLICAKKSEKGRLEE